MLVSQLDGREAVLISSKTSLPCPHMDILNDYLQRLLSSCSDELRLEPDKNPYLVSENATTDVAASPLMGTQISSMVFPLIPAGVKTTLPHRAEIEFVHPHSLGNFNFHVQKSSAGFIVTIRPVLNNSNGMIDVPKPLPVAPPTYEPEPFTQPQSVTTPLEPSYEFVPETAASVSYELESSSFDLAASTAEVVETASLTDLLHDEEPAQEWVPDGNGPELEVIAFNDPAYQTVFSDTAAYEPPGRRDDIAPAGYLQPFDENVPGQEFFSTPEPVPSVSFPVQNTPVETSFVAAAPNASEAAKMDVLFKKMAEMGASDLHLSVSMPPMVRKDGKMCELEAGGVRLTPESMRVTLTSIMPKKNQEEFSVRNDTDFAYEIPGLARFRCNVFMDRKGMGGVFRIIPSKILTAEQLGLSKAIMDLCNLSKGLVVVTGPTGSGKSTTLCAMVDSINKNREDHIITIEDPIEFTHENQKCLVNQREVHNHTDSFKDALRAALREDPDILLVGEIRDLETISIAIETAETGHLVFGTLHTTTAPSTVDRIIDQFPADRQQQIRVMLSESLKGVIAQTLLPKKGGGRVAALEVLIITPAISNLIREGKTFQIPSAMQTGKSHGMVMLNEALFEHVKNGLVEPMDAYVKAVDKPGFEAMLTRGGFKL